MNSAKGPFYYWSKNGSGANAWMEILGEHYTRLSASYHQNGFKKEAKLFAKIADEFISLQSEAYPSNKEKQKVSRR